MPRKAQLAIVGVGIVRLTVALGVAASNELDELEQLAANTPHALFEPGQLAQTDWLAIFE